MTSVQRNMMCWHGCSSVDNLLISAHRLTKSIPSQNLAPVLVLCSCLLPCRSCFLPRTPNTNLGSWQSGAGFALSSSPRVPASPIAAAAAGSNNGSVTGHSRHPAASHRIVVANPGNVQHPLSVLSQSDVLRYNAMPWRCS
jgi:hypothetical protein